jgi:chromosome segregation ATPase
MIADARAPWEDVEAMERERELQAAEDAATAALVDACLSAGHHSTSSANSRASRLDEVEVKPNRLHTVIRSIAKQGKAAKIAYEARSFRMELEADFAKAKIRHRARQKERAEQAGAVAAAATERITNLDAQATLQSESAVVQRTRLQERSTALQKQLSDISPEAEAVERELEEVEITQRELTQRLHQLSQRHGVLQKSKDALLNTKARLRATLSQVETDFAREASAQDDAEERTQRARALATAVAELATAARIIATDDAAGGRPLQLSSESGGGLRPAD